MRPANVICLSIDEAITGEALVALQHSDLKDLRVNSLGHRLKVLKAVYDMKLKHKVAMEADHYIPLCELHFYYYSSPTGGRIAG